MINTLLGLICVLLFPIIYITFVTTVILKDSKKYTNINAKLWILLSIFFPIVGFIIYLIYKGDTKRINA